MSMTLEAMHEASISYNNFKQGTLTLFKQGFYDVRSFGPLHVCSSFLPASIFNAVLHIGEPGLKEEQLVHALNYTAALEVPYLVFHEKDQESDSLFADFEKKGYLQKVALYNHSFSSLNNFAKRVYPEIKQVDSEDILEDFCKVTEISFQIPEGITFDLFSKIPALFSEDFPIPLFVYYHENTAIGAMALHLPLDNKVAGAYWGGILPQYNNQNIASRLVQHLVSLAKEKGYEYFVAQRAAPKPSDAEGLLEAYLTVPEALKGL